MKRNHERFRHAYDAWAELRLAEIVDPEICASYMTDDITMAAEEHAPRTKPRRIVTPPWWTPELLDARKALRAAARNLHVTGERQRYNMVRNAYTSTLRKCKIASWRKFCTIEGYQPWGKLYRWLTKGKGSCRQTTLGLLHKPDGSRCATLDASVDLLLNTLIPNNPLDQRTEQQQHTICDLQPYTVDQIRQFVWSLSPNRAPGRDGITASMIRVLWPRLSSRLLQLINECLRVARFPNV